MCENFVFKAEYFNKKKEVKIDLFSDYAEKVVNCFLNKGKKNSQNQIRKFYDELLNLKERVENGEDFRKILPYFKMLKAKANVAFSRGVINKNFKKFIDDNVDYVASGDLEHMKFKFNIFCTFFEAVVAYSR